jgi:hypothetical protein
VYLSLLLHMRHMLHPNTTQICCAKMLPLAWTSSIFQFKIVLFWISFVQPSYYRQLVIPRPIFMHGPRAANFQGRLKYGMQKKRLSTREKFKGDLYWKQCWYRVFSLWRYWR